MADMTREEFERQKNEAALKMKELYRGQTMPPYPDFIRVPQAEEKMQKSEPKKEKKPQKTVPNNLFRYLNLSEILKSPDALLILGLIFLLISDNADEKLILALVFIML